uniref:Serine/arginine repetitive matrix protein 4 n=1 Tax=Callorhinchus milii TaxID=7868 RepID=A0A4W3HPB5_CALMI
MASVHQGEKQLFEKFWRGTFKAVASPRQESIIVASITARKTLSNDTSSYQSYREPRTDEQRTEKPSAILATTGINGYSKAKENRHQNHHRVCSRSCHSARSPLPPSRGKKKKKKSEHKRKRSPSYSPAPARKKKKKSSKKHKRNR